MWGQREGTEACFGNCSFLSSRCTLWALCATYNQKSKSSLHVGFADSTDLHIWFEDDIQAQTFCLPADFLMAGQHLGSGCPLVADMKLSRFQVRPWHDGGIVRSYEPLDAQDSRITAPKKGISQFKITDHHFDNPARRPFSKKDLQKNLTRM